MKISIKKNLISGILIAIPFLVSLWILLWLLHIMANVLRPAVTQILPWLVGLVSKEPISMEDLGTPITVLSILLLIVLLYFVGTIGRFVMGRRLIAYGEHFFMNIPIVRTVFSSTKQVMKTMSLPDRTMFKSVVLVEFPSPGLKALGFFTGLIKDPEGKVYCKVFIPTTPNPTTGFFEMVPSGKLVETNISIEDGFKMVISGGIVSPEAFDYAAPPQNPASLPTKNSLELSGKNAE